MLEWPTTLLPVLLLALSSVIAVPNAVFSVEVIVAALFGRRTRMAQLRKWSRPRIGVLVPAHDESRNLLPTVADIKAQLAPGDRLLVVADNCSDDTAAVAAAAGAEIVERRELDKIGKGYALDWGIRHLSIDPPSIVIVIDADCRLSAGTVDQLALTTSATGRCSQALYLMAAPIGSSVRYQVAEFAWRVKNWVRPLGLHALNLPCQFVGTGMAFPWEIIRSANLATGHLVEDLKLGLELAAAGNLPLFCPSAVVKGTFPPTLKGAASQRERWEHGALALSFARTPGLVGRALLSGNVGLLALALDAAVPPLTLLGFLNVLVLLTTGATALCGIPTAALYLSLVSFMALLLAIVVAWMTHGRDVLPASSILLIGPYIFFKLRLYFRLLLHGPVSQWIRTDRE